MYFWQMFVYYYLEVKKFARKLNFAIIYNYFYRRKLKDLVLSYLLFSILDVNLVGSNWSTSIPPNLYIYLKKKGKQIVIVIA